MDSGKRFSSHFGSNDRVQELKEVLKGAHKEPVADKRQELLSDEGTSAEEPSLSPEGITDDALIESLKKQIELLESQLLLSKETVDKKDQEVLHARADFENMRKRLRRETEDQIRFSNEKLILEILPVIDNFEMTLSHVPSSISDDKLVSLIEGIKLTHKMFLGILEKMGIRFVSGEGAPFDPQYQEAVGTVNQPGVADGCVAFVHRKGVYLHERLLRPAMVSVCQISSSS